MTSLLRRRPVESRREKLSHLHSLRIVTLTQLPLTGLLAQWQVNLRRINLNRKYSRIRTSGCWMTRDLTTICSRLKRWFKGKTSTLMWRPWLTMSEKLITILAQKETFNLIMPRRITCSLLIQILTLKIAIQKNNNEFHQEACKWAAVKQLIVESQLFIRVLTVGNSSTILTKGETLMLA